jgi:hypothetical protein
MHEFLIELIAYVIPPAELLGAAVVLWGCLQGLVMLLRRALAKPEQAAPARCVARHPHRHRRKDGAGTGFLPCRRHHPDHRGAQQGNAGGLGRYRGDPYHDGLFPGQGNREERRR